MRIDRASAEMRHQTIPSIAMQKKFVIQLRRNQKAITKQRSVSKWRVIQLENNSRHK